MLNGIIQGIKSVFGIVKNFMVTGITKIPNLKLTDIVKIFSGAVGFLGIVKYIKSLFSRKTLIKPSTVVEEGITLGNPNNEKTETQRRIIKRVSKSAFENKRNRTFSKEEYDRRKNKINSMANKANFEKFESMSSDGLTKKDLNSPYAMHLRKVEKLSEPEIRELLMKDKYDRRMKFNDNVVDCYFMGDGHEFVDDDYDNYDFDDEFIEMIKDKYEYGEELDDFEMDCLKNHYIENGKKQKRKERRWQKRNLASVY